MLNQQGNNYTPATETLVASVDCDCGAIVPLHESYDDNGQDVATITTECHDCSQHWTVKGGLRATCANLHCDCLDYNLI